MPNRRSDARFDRWALYFGRIGLILGLTVLPIALAELVARSLYTPQPVRRVWDPFAYRIPQPGLIDSFRGRDEQVTIRLNERGMRGPSIAEPVADDTLTLVFLGGSTTENYAHNLADTFPEQTGRALAEQLGRKVRVWNAGASAATTAVNLSRLQHQVLDLEPSLVIVMHAINDLLGGFHPGYRSDGRHLAPPPLATLRPRSFLLDWARNRRAVQQVTTRVPPPEARREERRIDDWRAFPAYAGYARNLRSMRAIAAAHDVPIVFLTQPSMYSETPGPEDDAHFYLLDSVIRMGAVAPDIPSLARGMATFNDVVRSLEAPPESFVVDLARHVPKSWDLLYDECHYTTAGTRRVAEELTPRLAAILRQRAVPPAAPQPPDSSTTRDKVPPP